MRPLAVNQSGDEDPGINPGLVIPFTEADELFLNRLTYSKRLELLHCCNYASVLSAMGHGAPKHGRTMAHYHNNDETNYAGTVCEEDCVRI